MMIKIIKEQINLDLDIPEQQEVSDDMIPKPVGYHVLIVIPKIADTHVGSTLLKDATTLKHDHLLTMIGLVIDMGSQAYKDKSRFPDGPWCNVGDFVMFRPNSGTRFRISWQEYRLLNDDTIEAVITDPSKIERV